MTFRCPELLALAKLAPHCMGCGDPNTGRVVAAHSNQSRDGKGAGLKASDAMIALLGMRCHSRIDQGSDLTRAERVDFWEAAHRNTVKWLIESGHLVVRPPDYVEPIPPPKVKARVRKGRPLSGGAKLPGGGKIQSRNNLRKKP